MRRTNLQPQPMVKASRKLYEQVVDAVGLLIVRGDYAIGSALPKEDDLSSEYGVSRSVIREATKVLVEKGLLQSHRKVGTMVQPREQWNLLDADVLRWEYEAGNRSLLLRNVTEVRLLIEPEAARLAALRASDEEMARIDGAYREMERTVDSYNGYMAADMVFHGEILSACDNELLERMANTMRYAMMKSREVTMQVPNSSRLALPYHYDVLTAIQSRDGSAAYDAMLTLIQRAASDIENMLKEDGNHRNH